MPVYLYFDDALNVVFLPVRALCLYSRSDAQTYDVPYWLLTPSAYVTLFRRVNDADHEWAAGRLAAGAHARICETWGWIDVWAREHLDAALIDDAFARMARTDRPLPLPRPPARQDAWHPWTDEVKA